MLQELDLKNKYQELQAKLKHWSHSYYIENISIVSDAVYDAHLEELKKIENEYPELVETDSITQTIGAGVYKTSFAKIQHEIPMMSLDNAFGEADILAWEERVNRIIGEETSRSYVFELKIDGLSISIDYKNGQLYRAATRGDGKIGEDVTPNVFTIKSLPKSIPFSQDCTIRGEVYLPKTEFNKLNESRKAQNLELYANPRNTASGALRQLDPKITAERNLDIIPYGFYTKARDHEDDENAEIVVPQNNHGTIAKRTNSRLRRRNDRNVLEVHEDHEDDENAEVVVPQQCLNTHWKCLEQLGKLGFKMHSSENHLCKSIQEVINLYHEWQEKKDSLDIEIDGAVVKINELSLQKTLGVTSKFPRWAMALKFKAEEAVTTITSIDYEVGRTGIITPVANLEPVLLAGTTVKRASLHNFDQIERLGIAINDAVVVRKAGEIIPEIVSKKEVTKDSIICENILKITKPIHCPACESILEQEDVALRCPNIVGCPAQIQRRIEHWVSKNALDISGLGPSIIEQLLEFKLITNPFDLYRLNYEQLIALDRMADKSVNNLLTAIASSRQQPFHRFLHALGIKHVGLNLAQLIASLVPDLKSLEEEILIRQGSELIKLDGLGDKILISLSQFFKSEIYQQIKRDYEELKFNFQEPLQRKLSNLFEGKTFVITGTLSESRSHFEKLIKDNGGKTSSSISKNTNYLLCGEDAGSKLDKAIDLGVQVINEEEFMALLQ